MEFSYWSGKVMENVSFGRLVTVDDKARIV